MQMSVPKPMRAALWASPVIVLLAAGYAYWRSPDHAPDSDTGARLQCITPAEPADAPHPGMAWVPEGRFSFGDTVYPEEQPLRTVTVQGFWMDRTEVTNAQFAEFVAATRYVTVAERALDPKAHPGLSADLLKPGAVVFINPLALTRGGDVRQWWQYVPGANWRHPGGPATSIAARGAFPVVAITIEDAQAYARWKGHALPTEAEWEWAALGARAADLRDHTQPLQANTWQGMFPVNNQATDGFAGLAPVACFAANALGLHDMVGNVWELTADRYTTSHSPQDNIPPDQPPAAERLGSTTGRHVIKGGSYLCAPNYCMRYRAGARQAQEDDLATSHVGFRTVLRASGP